jgi:uncharacterized protein
MSDMTCPKCHAAMRSYERNGVHIDQCTECRGIFLDRGELEHLITAESAWSAAPAAPASPPPPPRNDSRGYESYDSRSYDSKPKYQKRKKSFLEDLFD